jgi:hypothetical protein
VRRANILHDIVIKRCVFFDSAKQNMILPDMISQPKVYISTFCCADLRHQGRMKSKSISVVNVNKETTKGHGELRYTTNNLC